MSLAVKLTSLTIASVGESDVGAGAGVGAGWAAASPGLVGAACFEVFDVVRAAERARRFCATALKDITSASKKTKGDLRFIKCIFLAVGSIVNSGNACQFSHRLKRINFAGRLIGTKSYDARKAQSVTALVPI